MIAQRFLADVKGHELRVIKDEGVYRHLRFKKPTSSDMYFDLVTWPGYLAYSGDMGCYVFTRVNDMFQFFRPHEGQLEINPGYWQEKVEAADKGAGLKKFSEEKFTRAVLSHLIEWIRDTRGRTTKDERRALWDAVMIEVIGADGDNGGYRKQCAAHDFRHEVNSKITFYFQDFWECNVEEYSPRFLWCCYAIQWGIGVYDARQSAQTEAAPCAQ